MPAATAPPVGHVGIDVTDLDRSVAFYTAVFGFDVVAARADAADPSRRVALPGRDGLILVTLWEQAADGHDGERARFHHLPFPPFGEAPTCGFF
jgi:lactoylglutathione lyase